MTREEAEAVLTAAGVAADDDFPLFEAAIACALHEDPPTAMPDPARALTAEAAERLKGRLRRESPEEALAETMSGDMRLNGDLMTYEDPGQHRPH